MNQPYVGIGPSAVSKVGHERAGNAKGIGAYKRRVAEQGHAREWSEELPPARRLAETWWLGLRLTRGVDPEEARATAGWAEPEDPAVYLARRLAERGLLEHCDGHWRLTAAGIPLADGVAAEFLGDGS